ncbi:GNAT family N-acetyltransferase [Rhizobium sp. KVB221]|uniref:GNAT family N-acetyltransferase n=1 Tax=Rhizobium setariae TaxID=2801340 RepID=A0A936YKT3_9HYPH|nr:GNAT family protein [Rhizobium setariae]MBL0372239.1 GNAT family N-acetyltransferase [Rhizobium setariae]
MEDLKNWKPRPAVQPVTLKGRYVTVEPYKRAEHLGGLWDALGQEGINQLLQYFAAPDFADEAAFGDWLDAVAKTGWITEIFRDNTSGKILGMANYMRTDTANGVTEVGGVAHGPAMARSPISTEVHYLMAKHVFEDLGYRRYEWKCHNGNAKSKVTAERLGFTFEGVFRKHSVSRGGNRDTAWFSIIDDEWPLLNAAFEAWLDPANFDADGMQKKTLVAIRSGIAKEIEQ